MSAGYLYQMYSTLEILPSNVIFLVRWQVACGVKPDIYTHTHIPFANRFTVV